MVNKFDIQFLIDCEQRRNMFRILHLSDIHIGKTYKESDSIACRIASDIDYNGLGGIGCIAVTGDIFDGQVPVDKSEFLINKAVNFFEILLTEINSNQEKKQISKEDILFVPGNHDLIRVEDLEKRWSKYHSFLEKFYGKIPDYYFENNYSLVKEYKEHKVVFIGFNSCEIERKKLFDDGYISKFERYIDNDELKKNGIDKSKVIEAMKAEVANEYDDYGFIPLPQITPIGRKIKQLDDYTVVALFHHHFYLFPEIACQFGDSSLIRNYTEVIQQLRYLNVSVVLHGHKHFALERPYITDDYYESADNIIDVFAGGSVGTDRKEEHTFGVLDLYEKKDDIKLKHHKFVYNGENLEPIIRKQVPPQKMTGRVVKLLEILKTIDADGFKLYEASAEKAFKSYDDCNRIISWVSEAITGFVDVYKYLHNDHNNILFLLYAINYRTICYMKIVGKEDSYFESASKTWSDFYDQQLTKTDFMISKDEYHEMFMFKKLKETASHCDLMLNKCDNKKSQRYLAFTMLGMFFTDLYLILTKYADDFKESIQYKVNIKIEENKFHENVPAPRIVVKSDADRRSAYIEMLCNEATAHKMAVLFIKEFDLLINKYEDYFKIIGLKLYYLLPRIDKNSMKNTLDNYNFEAYIPTLIPLLTGDNIYSSKVVFARELIQNSIDAISVREAKTADTEFSKEITIKLKRDENGKRYFEIADSGTGMDRYKIERYFTSIGRSFYSGQEYEDLNIGYKPISNFGIGFLSSFMVCQEIDVKTKYYLENSEGLKLHIPNYDGCFFIELDEDANIGTKIKLYLETDITNEEIANYVGRVMQDIKYPISIQFINKKGHEQKKVIPAHAIRMQNKKEDFKFFIPFQEDGNIKEINYSEVVNNQYITEYEYGMLIRRSKNFEIRDNCMILNSGIEVEGASPADLMQKKIYNSKYRYSSYEEGLMFNNVVINFPSNWLQLDVARDNITAFTNTIKFSREQVARCFYKQILQFIEYTKEKKTDIEASCLQELIYYAINISENPGLKGDLKKLRYILLIKFVEDGICYRIFREEDCKENFKLEYSGEKAKKEYVKKREKLDQLIGKDTPYNDNGKTSRKKMERLIEEVVSRDDLGNPMGRTNRRRLIVQLPRSLSAYLKENNEDIFKAFSYLLLKINDKLYEKISKEHLTVMNDLEMNFLQYFHVGLEETKEIKVKYDELLKFDF